MMPFNVALPPVLRSDLLVLIQVIFWVFVPASFIYVGNYAINQNRVGQLINGKNSPLGFRTADVIGWLYILFVLQFVFVQSPLYVILVLAGTLGLLLENGRTAQEQFGLNRIKPVRVASWSLLVFGAVMLVEVPLTNASLWLLNAFHVPNQEQETVESFRHINQVSTIAWFVFQAVFIFPMIEELFFRGFLLTFLKKYTNTWAAIILSGGVFAFAHANLAAALPLWLLGIALGIAYEHTGCILLPMGIHACWNLVTALSILLDKGTP